MLFLSDLSRENPKKNYEIQTTKVKGGRVKEGKNKLADFLDENGELLRGQISVFALGSDQNNQREPLQQVASLRSFISCWGVKWN